MISYLIATDFSEKKNAGWGLVFEEFGFGAGREVSRAFSSLLSSSSFFLSKEEVGQAKRVNGTRFSQMDRRSLSYNNKSQRHPDHIYLHHFLFSLEFLHTPAQFLNTFNHDYRTLSDIREGRIMSLVGRVGSGLV